MSIARIWARALCDIPSKIGFKKKTSVFFLRGSFFCFVGIFAFYWITGCATVANSLNPQNGADKIAADSGFSKEIIPTKIFTLTAYSRLKNREEPLVLYIEGDGRAWLSQNRLSDDPTPFHPLVLQLASIDPSSNVVYLGRPCQYDGSAVKAPCSPEYWSDKRFSEEVVESMNEAVEYFADKI